MHVEVIRWGHPARQGAPGITDPVLKLRVKSDTPDGKILEVALPLQVVEMLKAQGPKATGRVFLYTPQNCPRSEIGKPLPFDSLRLSFHSALRYIGVPVTDKRQRVKGFHIHDLRHTFATQAYRNGVELEQLQQMLGHANIETTRAYIGYEHMSMEEKQRAVREAAAGIFAAVPGLTPQGNFDSRASIIFRIFQDSPCGLIVNVRFYCQQIEKIGRGERI